MDRCFGKEGLQPPSQIFSLRVYNMLTCLQLAGRVYLWCTVSTVSTDYAQGLQTIRVRVYVAYTLCKHTFVHVHIHIHMLPHNHTQPGGTPSQSTPHLREIGSTTLQTYFTFDSAPPPPNPPPPPPTPGARHLDMVWALWGLPSANGPEQGGQPHCRGSALL